MVILILTKAKPGHNFDPSYLANDVKNQALLQSMLDINHTFHVDIIARYLDYLPKTLVTVQIPGYFTFDTRVAPRGIYAKLTVRI